MSDQGGIIPYKKVCTIDDGVITTMYWEHPRGNEMFDHTIVINRWTDLYGEEGNFTDPRFLSSQGFFSQNVIRDGVRVDQ